MPKELQLYQANLKTAYHLHVFHNDYQCVSCFMGAITKCTLHPKKEPMAIASVDRQLISDLKSLKFQILKMP
jgi:hypothetical protein